MPVFGTPRRGNSKSTDFGNSKAACTVSRLDQHGYRANLDRAKDTKHGSGTGPTRHHIQPSCVSCFEILRGDEVEHVRSMPPISDR